MESHAIADNSTFVRHAALDRPSPPLKLLNLTFHLAVDSPCRRCRQGRRPRKKGDRKSGAENAAGWLRRLNARFNSLRSFIPGPLSPRTSNSFLKGDDPKMIELVHLNYGRWDCETKRDQRLKWREQERERGGGTVNKTRDELEHGTGTVNLLAERLCSSVN